MLGLPCDVVGRQFSLKVITWVLMADKIQYTDMKQATGKRSYMKFSGFYQTIKSSLLGPINSIVLT